MQEKFSEMGDFSIISSLRAATPEKAIEDIIDSQRQGAAGFLLHAEILNKQYRNAADIQKIIRAAHKPVMILNYRSEEDGDDERLNQLKLDAILAGAAAADVPMYTFDGDTIKSLEGCKKSFAAVKPAEVSMDKKAIGKQKALIEKMHALGGEVLMSAHVCTMLSAEQAFEVAEQMKKRGADIAKIIVVAKSLDDVAEIYRTIRLLKRDLKIPFLYQTCGVYGKLVRPTVWIFGSKYILCHNRYSERSNTEKPLIRDVETLKINYGVKNLKYESNCYMQR